jgi:hypothetical protein
VIIKIKTNQKNITLIFGLNIMVKTPYEPIIRIIYVLIITLVAFSTNILTILIFLSFMNILLFQYFLHKLFHKWNLPLKSPIKGRK